MQLAQAASRPAGLDGWRFDSIHFDCRKSFTLELALKKMQPSKVGYGKWFNPRRNAEEEKAFDSNGFEVTLLLLIF